MTNETISRIDHAYSKETILIEGYEKISIMLSNLKLLPNQITALRLLLIPFLWIAAIHGFSLWVGIGVAVAFMTDILDGLIARKLNLVSSFGAKFDSLADNLLQPSVGVWLWILRPRVFTDNPVIWIIAIAIYFSSLSVGLVKFRRFGNLHLYSSKYSALLTFPFAIHTFISSQYSELLLYSALICWIISSSETLILQLVLPQVNEHLGSLVFIITKKKAPT